MTLDDSACIRSARRSPRFSTGPGSLLVFRLITGLGVGGEWAVGHALLAESSPQRMRGRASALLQAGEPVGVGLAAVVGLLVAPLIGWRAVFLVSSASALIALRGAPAPARVAPVGPRSTSERLSPVAALRLLARGRPGGVPGQGLRARRLQARHLLDLLHLAAQVPAERDGTSRSAARRCGS